MPSSLSDLSLRRPSTQHKFSYDDQTSRRQLTDVRRLGSQTEEDPHSDTSIIATYELFEKHIDDCDHQLGQFISECRQLGRSYALILAARDLREGLASLLSMFRDNAARLVPSLVARRSTLSLGLDTVDKPFYSWLRDLADAFTTFRERLNEFREYTDESAKVKTLMKTFSNDLMYRAACLEAHKDTLHTHYMYHYINDLAGELCKDLGSLTSAFKFFNEYGMPAMQYEQRRGSDVLLNLSTVSTFFSAVTATTLQSSLSLQPTEVDGGNLIFLVNSFWFCSLILSIGAALNSLLAVLWKRTPYGSRGRRLPAWVTIWIHASPPAFLGISIATFSTGLVLFAYSSNQKAHTKFVTLVATAITSFGLLTITAWFAYEQYVAPLLLPDAPWQLGRRIHEWKSSIGEKSQDDDPILSSKHHRIRTDSLSGMSAISSASSTLDSPTNILTSRLPVSEILRKVPGLRRETAPAPETFSDVEDQPIRPSGKAENPKWKRGAKLASTLMSATKAFQKGTPLTPRSHSASDIGSASTVRSPISPFLLKVPEIPQVTLPRLPGVIQDMEYSSSGEYLAATYYEENTNTSKTIIYTVGATRLHSSHTHQKMSKAISWSIDGATLLVRLSHRIDFLDKECTRVSTVKPPTKNPIESAIWVTSDSILVVEQNKIFRMSVDGLLQASHQFGSLLLRDVAVVPESNLLLVVGRVIHTHDDNNELVPSNSRAEKQIVVYDQKTSQSLSRHPLLDDIRHVQISRSLTVPDQFDVLLSQKNKHAPLLWSIQIMDGVHRLVPETRRLFGTDFGELSGYGHFIGDNDNMLAFVDLDGNVQIWDRETVKPVRRIPVQAKGKGRRCFAWSEASATFASADDLTKELKIWPISYWKETEVPSSAGWGNGAHSGSISAASRFFDEPSSMYSA